MDIEKAKKVFENYVKQYDLENPRMKLKFQHSHRVMDCAGRIAQSLKLSEEKVELAKLIGLLHDIGRFEQIRIYNTFTDHKSIDHGDLGAEILEKDNYIREYIEEEKYDNIILKAITNHNKFKIEEGLSEEEFLFAKLIRDADKLDIFYEGAEMFWNTEEEREKIGKSKITKEVLKEFNDKHLIDRRDIVTLADSILSFIAFVFDLNFKYTYEIIKKEKYIKKILDKFIFKDEVTAEQMEQIRERAEQLEISNN